MCEAGNCQPVTGECGFAQNHVWVTYKCGDEPGCPSCPPDQVCDDHLCVEPGLTCPESGIVGDEETCLAVVGYAVCANCDFMVTDPRDDTLTGKTSSDGTFVLPLTLEGLYKVAVLQDGVVVSEVEIEAIPKAPPIEPVKPTPAQPIPNEVLYLLLLLILLILFFYYRRRKKKEKS
jgi:hypothetical protein